MDRLDYKAMSYLCLLGGLIGLGLLIAGPGRPTGCYSHKEGKSFFRIEERLEYGAKGSEITPVSYNNDFTLHSNAYMTYRYINERFEPYDCSIFDESEENILRYQGE